MSEIVSDDCERRLRATIVSEIVSEIVSDDCERTIVSDSIMSDDCERR